MPAMPPAPLAPAPFAATSFAIRPLPIVPHSIAAGRGDARARPVPVDQRDPARVAGEEA
jgi:hypothetical protein